MMKEIVLDQTTIKYQVSYKNNKNTYFYFKPEGYIQVNAAKRQTQSTIIAFIKANKDTFIRKYALAVIPKKVKTGYQLFSKEYQIVKDSNVNTIVFDPEKMQVIEPETSKEELGKQYKAIEKKALLSEVEKLLVKYQDNGLIDCSNIFVKTRYTTSRFGSCNPKKRSINFNLHLAHYPEVYLEYVFLHEICHLVHFNHSKDFYNLLSQICPEYKRLKKELNAQFKG